MKLFRNSIILIIMLAILIGLYLYANRTGVFDKSILVYKIDKAVVKSASLVTRDSRIVFVKENGKLQIVSPSNYKMAKETAEALEKSLMSMEALRVIEKDAKDVKVYGLAEPSVTLEVKLDNGEEKTVYIGDETASKYQYYAMLKGVRTVYTISSDYMKLYSGRLADFRDREILAVDIEQLNSVRFFIKDKQEICLGLDNSGQWAIVEPFNGGANKARVKEFLSNITGLRIIDFVSDNGNEKDKYWLDRPEYTIKLRDSDGNEQSLLFGKRDSSDQKIYIGSDKDEGVFSVSLNQFNPANTGIGAFLNETPFSVNIEKVNKIIIRDKGKQTEFDRDMERKSDAAFRLKGKAVNESDFRTLYFNLMALNAEGYDPGIHEDNPQFTVTFLMQENEKTITGDYTPRDSSTYYLKINGNSLPLYVGNKKVELIRKWVNRIENSGG